MRPKVKHQQNENPTQSKQFLPEKNYKNYICIHHAYLRICESCWERLQDI